VTSRLAEALAAIDDANADDPNIIVIAAHHAPLAQAHGQLACGWVSRLHTDPPDEWLLAARAHHLRRWEVPRNSYPPGKLGYQRWKKDQRRRHAADVADILQRAGYNADSIERTQAIIRRDNITTDEGSQAVEDAACLAFFETQLAHVASTLQPDHVADVLRKTLRKMTEQARTAARGLPLEPRFHALIVIASDD
jgi:hypothetical protein